MARERKLLDKIHGTIDCNLSKDVNCDLRYKLSFNDKRTITIDVNEIMGEIRKRMNNVNVQCKERSDSLHCEFEV